jgi:hypothetical protein
MTRSVHGKIHGKTIELTEDLGLAEGQEVAVRVEVVHAGKPWGEGILRSAGIMADDPDWDRIMEEVYQARKLPRRAQTEGE